MIWKHAKAYAKQLKVFYLKYKSLPLMKRELGIVSCVLRFVLFGWIALTERVHSISIHNRKQ